MASDECDETALTIPESEDDLLARHKKERKELQAQVQKLKHGVPKGDKKKKKEVTEQVAKLEADLDSRHADELENFKAKQEAEAPVTTDNDQPAEKDEEDEEGAAEVEESTGTSSGRKSKAQKRREKKVAKGKERENRIKEQEVENKRGPRHLEMSQIKALLKPRGQALYEIPADGNCLYNAISHQLLSQNQQMSNEELRQKTAQFMRSHPDDFLPFLTHPDTGDMLTPEEFDKYCDKTANSPAWGGQIELKALSEVLRVPIQVVQADSQPVLIGEEMGGDPLTVVYHRHVYRLGEHYNSIIPASQIQEEDPADDDSLT